MEILIRPDGQLRYVYDELLDLSSIGPLNICRGSHVEPLASGLWSADLSPVNGPVLGPFAKRSAAVAAEVRWLEQHWLLSSDR